jgi:hypothetical protein
MRRGSRFDVRHPVHDEGRGLPARCTLHAASYTLRTGDPGLAAYIRYCIQGTAGMPALDVLQ